MKYLIKVATRQFRPLVMLAALLCASGSLKAQDRFDPLGEHAAPIILKTLEGKVWNLESSKGKAVIVNFWASWCGPCNIEAPSLESAYRNLDKKKVGFIAIAVDDTETDASQFAKAYGLTFPIAVDLTGNISNTYRISIVPKTVIIGKDGRIKYTHMGVITPADISRELKKIL